MKITSGQLKSIIILFLCGSTLVLGTSAKLKNDLIIGIIISIIIGIIFTFIYCKIIILNKNLDFFQINEFIYGKFIGSVINLFYLFYFFHLGILVLNNLVYFINTIALDMTPQILILSIFVLLVIWVIREGEDVLGRWSQLFIYILVISIIINIVLLIPHFKFDNIKPLFNSNIKSFALSTFSTFTFPFGEIVCIFPLVSNLEKSEKLIGIFIKGTIIGGSIILLESITEVLVLGGETIGRYFFPYYIQTTVINVGEIFTRVDIITSLVFIIGVFVKSATCFFSFFKGLSHLFKLKSYNYTTLPIGIIIVILTMSNYDSIFEMQEFAMSTYSFYAIPFQIVIPLVTLLLSYLKGRE